MADNKLKLLYDAFDNKNYKQALKLCNSMLQKQSRQQQLVKALRGLTLERLGKEEEALEQCLQVVAELPTENNVLETLVLGFKGLGKLNEITKMYEKLMQQYPKNETYAIAVFNSYVRLNDYANQNKTAMQLWRQFNKDKYLCWYVMGTILQAKEANLPRLLELAEKFLQDKLIAENKIQDVETLEVYLRVLQEQKKHDKVVEVLQGPLGSLYKLPQRKEEMIVESLMASQKLKEASLAYENLLTNFDSDDWKYWETYIDLAFKQGIDSTGPAVEKLLSTISMNSKDKRGVHLARLEFLYRKIDLSPNEELKTSLLKGIFDYFKTFGSKTICYNDLKKYLLSFSGQSDYALQQLVGLIPSPSSELEDEKKRMGYLVCYRSIQVELFKAHEKCSFDKRLAICKELLEEYKIFNSKFTKEETEIPQYDQFVYLTSFIIINSLKDQAVPISTKKAVLLESITLLEHVLSTSKYSFNLKFQLIEFYRAIGGVSESYNWFKSLDVKHILYDTMSYIVLDDLLVQGDTVSAQTLLDNILQFHDENTKQTPDFVIRAYNHASYSRISEIINFKARLERSTQLSVALVEKEMLQFLNSSNSFLEASASLLSLKFPIVPEAKLNKLQNNEDRSVNRVVRVDTLGEPKSSAYTHNMAIESQKSNLKQRERLLFILQTMVKQSELDSVQLSAFSQTMKDLNTVVPSSDLQGTFYSMFYEFASGWSSLLNAKVSSEKGEDENEAKHAKNFLNTVSTCKTTFSALSSLIINSISSSQLLSTTFSQLNYFLTEVVVVLLVLLDATHQVIPGSKKKKGALVLEVKVVLKEFLQEIKTALTSVTTTLSKERARIVEENTTSACVFIDSLVDKEKQVATSKKVGVQIDAAFDRIIQKAEKATTYIKNMKM